MTTLKFFKTTFCFRMIFCKGFHCLWTTIHLYSLLCWRLRTDEDGHLVELIEKGKFSLVRRVVEKGCRLSEMLPEGGFRERKVIYFNSPTPLPFSLSLSLSFWIIMIIIITTYIYNVPNDALGAHRIHNKLKTMLSKYIYVQNRQS